MNTFKQIHFFAVLIMALATGVATASAEDITRAIASVHPTEGNSVWGVVEFIKVDDGIRISATIHGLEPNQKHGFHIHEWGNCTAPDAERAGGHFDPTDAPHGAPWDQERHAGDLGNIEADEMGIGRYHRIDCEISFTGKRSIIGRSVVVHERADDYTTQPTGDVGARIGCGVIGIAEPQD